MNIDKATGEVIPEGSISLNDENSISLNVSNVEVIKDAIKKEICFSKKLNISNFDDKNQIKIIQTAKTSYVTNRNTIKRAFKSKRDEWRILSEDNIKLEKEVVGLMQEEEDRLSKMLEHAKLLSLREQNKDKMDLRINSLKRYDHSEDESILLDMTDKQFKELETKVREDYLEKKEKEIAEEQARLDNEERIRKAVQEEKERAEKQRILDLENAEKKRKDDLRKAEEEKERAVEKAKQDEINRQEKEKQKIAEEERVRKEKEEADKKNKEYTDFLKENNFDDKNMILKRDGNTFFIYKLFASKTFKS